MYYQLSLLLWPAPNCRDEFLHPSFKFSGLWLKHDRYREQPWVRFKLEYLLYAETSDPAGPLICGNFPRTLNNAGFCPTIKVYNNATDYSIGPVQYISKTTIFVIFSFTFINFYRINGFGGRPVPLPYMMRGRGMYCAFCIK